MTSPRSAGDALLRPLGGCTGRKVSCGSASRISCAVILEGRFPAFSVALQRLLFAPRFVYLRSQFITSSRAASGCRVPERPEEHLKIQNEATEQHERMKGNKEARRRNRLVGRLGSRANSLLLLCLVCLALVGPLRGLLASF